MGHASVASAAWVDALEPGAPDIVASWRGIDAGRLVAVRREVRRRAGYGTAASIATQLGTLADALTAVVADLPDDAFAMPGGEGDWNVAQAIGHAADSRAGLVMAASLAASGRWPDAAPPAVPGIPGPADPGRETLLRRLAASQRVVERAARAIEGHETDPCPLEHPIIGRLRCGEWLLWAGVHDLMHLDQLEGIERSIGGAAARTEP